MYNSIPYIPDTVRTVYFSERVGLLLFLEILERSFWQARTFSFLNKWKIRYTEFKAYNTNVDRKVDRDMVRDVDCVI